MNDEQLLGMAGRYREILRKAVYLLRSPDADGRLSTAQPSTLHKVAAGPARVSDIAKNAGIRVARATEQIIKLETAGLVPGIAHARDARVVLVRLTDAGRLAAGAVAPPSYMPINTVSHGGPVEARLAADTAHEVEMTFTAEKASLPKQPKAVWAVAVASVFAFMGIGLVDPILPAIAVNLNATPSQVPLLFTSYFLVTAFAVLVTGFVSSRIGGKRTPLIALGIIVVFAALAGTSGRVGELVGFRAGWGLGNALFVATALAVMVGVASGGSASAIIRYEAALGLGLPLGPLMDALLGGRQWRAPFFGTNASLAGILGLLMAVLVGMGLAAGQSITTIVVLVIISGALLGINNTLYTGLAMSLSIRHGRWPATATTL